jgi:hypothetical protein
MSLSHFIDVILQLLMWQRLIANLKKKTDQKFKNIKIGKPKFHLSRFFNESKNSDKFLKI